MLLATQWLLLNELGSGSFGKTFRAYDTVHLLYVAVKFEFQHREKMEFEWETLKTLHPSDKDVQKQCCNLAYDPPRTRHVPLLYAYGIENGCRYMVMELMGPSLSQLREIQPNAVFSFSTTLRLGLSTLNAIQFLHSNGYIHRDIKPSNFVTDKSELTPQNCYLIDFGEARRYKNEQGTKYAYRRNTRFHGTVRYASPNAHQGLDLSRHDDLWSWFFMLVEFQTGTLPWRSVGGSQNREMVHHLKTTSIETDSLVADLPKIFHAILTSLKTSYYAYDECFFRTPDYTYLRNLLTNECKRHHINFGDPYDWQPQRQERSPSPMRSNSSPSPRNSRPSPPSPLPPPPPPLVVPPLRRSPTPPRRSPSPPPPPPPVSPPSPSPRRFSMDHVMELQYQAANASFTDSQSAACAPYPYDHDDDDDDDDDVSGPTCRNCWCSCCCCCCCDNRRRHHQHQHQHQHQHRPQAAKANVENVPAPPPAANPSQSRQARGNDDGDDDNKSLCSRFCASLCRILCCTCDDDDGVDDCNETI